MSLNVFGRARVLNEYTTIINEDLRRKAFSVINLKIKECVVKKQSKCPVTFESKELRELVIDLSPLFYNFKISLKDRTIFMDLSKTISCTKKLNGLINPEEDEDDQHYLNYNISVPLCLGEEVVIDQIKYPNSDLDKMSYKYKPSKEDNSTSFTVYPFYSPKLFKKATAFNRAIQSLNKKGVHVKSNIIGYFYSFDKNCLPIKEKGWFFEDFNYSHCINESKMYSHYVLSLQIK